MASELRTEWREKMRRLRVTNDGLRERVKGLEGELAKAKGAAAELMAAWRVQMQIDEERKRWIEGLEGRIECLTREVERMGALGVGSLAESLMAESLGEVEDPELMKGVDDE